MFLFTLNKAIQINKQFRFRFGKGLNNTIRLFFLKKNNKQIKLLLLLFYAKRSCLILS